MEHEEETPLTPLKEFWSGPMRATIWHNTYTDLDGREQTYATVHVRRRYCTDAGEHADSPYFGADDLPQLAAVVQAAYAWLSVQDGADADPTTTAGQAADLRTSPVLVQYSGLEAQ